MILPKIDYMSYKSNIEKYVVVDADVLESDRIILLPGKLEPIISYKKNIVKYTMNGVDYTQKIYSYPEIQESSQIKIAVKIDNHTKIKRCIAYHMDKNQKIRWYIESIVIIVFIMLFFLNNYFIKKKETKIKCIEKDFNAQMLEKQCYILEHIQQSSRSEEELKEQLEYYHSRGIRFNEGTLWVLKNCSNSEEIKAIFSMSPLIDKDRYFNFLNEMYEQGFPENYYVLAKYDENYYCCCKESERLYMYSRAIGITNTPYETVYDYIIQQIDKR